MKRTTSVLIALLAFGCQRGPAPEAGPGAAKRPVVGVTLLTQTHDFFKDLEGGLRAEAQARNIDVVVTACEMAVSYTHLTLPTKRIV